MTMKTYAVALGSSGGASCEVRVPAPTDVQAGDAARPLAQEGESILEIREIHSHDGQALDADPPKSQAAELASVTPGAAAAPDPDAPEGDRHG